MMRMMRAAGLLLAGLMLAGCWQSNGALYGDAQALKPFQSRPITQTDKNRHEVAYTFTANLEGGYDMINSDVTDSQFGHVTKLRFFPLAGSPNFLVYEATMPTCKPNLACEALPAGAPRYYGLLQVTPDTVTELRPDCGQEPDKTVAQKLGVASDGSNCVFTSTAQLEQALVALAKSGRKADYIYRATPH
jgi:hypothetical protein